MAETESPETIIAFDARLLEVAAKLPKRLRQCAAYVAANKDRIAVSTVAEMAEGAGVQPSAFIRFSQMLGFSGYSEMQKLFRNAYAGGWPDYMTRLHHLREKSEDSASALLAEFAEAGRTSLETLLQTIVPPVLDAAVALLARANIIHVVGMRRSFPVASYLAYSFEKMSVPAMLHGAVGNLDSRHAIQPGDVVLAVTFSPYSTETVDLVQAVHARNIPVVAITDTVVSPVRQFATNSLSVVEVDFGAFRSLSATLCLAMALSVAVGAARPEIE